MSQPHYQPDVRCPTCGRLPRIAYTKKQLTKWADDPTHAVVQTYQCTFEKYPGRKCNTIFRIRAGDLHRARLVDSAHHIQG